MRTKLIKAALLARQTQANLLIGGIGANAGFQDAAALCDTLTGFSATASEHERVETVTAFETAMLERAKSAVEKGVTGGGHFFGMKPLAELKAVAL